MLFSFWEWSFCPHLTFDHAEIVCVIRRVAKREREKDEVKCLSG